MKYSFFLYQYLLIYYLTPQTGRLLGVLPLVQISLLLLLIAFVFKLRDMKIFYNKQLAYSTQLLLLIVILTIMIFVSMFISNDVSNSIYLGTRILLYIFIPFYFVAMVRHIDLDKIIDLFILIALFQVGFALFEQITHINIFDYIFTYVKDIEDHNIRFDLFRVNTSMGPLALGFLFVTVYPLTYYKNSPLYRVTRYLIPLGTVMTVSISAMGLMALAIIILNFHKLKKLFSLVKLMMTLVMTLSVLVYYGIIEKIITSVSIVVLAVEATDASIDQETGINASSRVDGFIQLFELMQEYIFDPIGYGELFNNWDRYMPFSTDPGIPFMWGVEIGVWSLFVYIAIFVTAFKLLKRQKKLIVSKYIVISLFLYMLMSFTTGHTSTLLIPFLLFGIIIKFNLTDLKTK